MRTSALLMLATLGVLPAGLNAEEAMTPVVVVSAGSCAESWPQAAYNPNRDEFLVVWFEDCSVGTPAQRIFARRLDRYGRPKGDVYQVSPEGGGNRNRAFPSVVHDRMNDRYLVVYEYDYWGNNTDRDVRGRYLAGDGSPTGDEIVVSQSTLDEWNPEAAFSHVSQKYLVAWTRMDAIDPDTVWASLFSFGGAPGAFPLAPAATGNRAFPDLSYDPFADRFMAAFDTDADLVAVMVDAIGAVGAEIEIAAWPDVETAAAVASCENWQHLVVWESLVPPANYEIYSRFLLGSGVVDGGPIPITSTTGDERYAEVACIYGGIHYLLVWEQEFAGGSIGVSGRRISSTKALRDAAVIRAPSTDRPAVAGGRPGWLVVWTQLTPDPSGADLHARVLWELFADGFEWGDTTTWSSTQP